MFIHKPLIRASRLQVMPPPARVSQIIRNKNKTHVIFFSFLVPIRFPEYVFTDPK